MIKVNTLFLFFSSWYFLKEIENMFFVFLSSFRNTHESLGELWKHLPVGLCSHNISCSPKLSIKQLDYELEISFARQLTTAQVNHPAQRLRTDILIAFNNLIIIYQSFKTLLKFSSQTLQKLLLLSLIFVNKGTLLSYLLSITEWLMNTIANQRMTFTIESQYRRFMLNSIETQYMFSLS